MKKLSWVDRLIFIVNSLFATALLFSNLIPYIRPTSFPSIAVLGLIVPGLIVINIVFVIYWIVRLRKQFLVSTIVLLIGFHQISALYKLAAKQVFLNDDFKVMSYNVRVFNIYNWKKAGEREILNKVVDFVSDKDPDVVCFQEFNTRHGKSFGYKYNYVKNIPSKYTSNFGMAILSNHKIINKGSLDFDETANNTIFVDIIRNNDTIRIYNVHLESQKIQLKTENLNEENRDRLFKRLKKTFVKQVAQVNQILDHEKKCHYKTIIMGDFNNTAFSWAYHQLKGDKNDAFIEAGSNFGKSYDFILPARIDFILTDQRFEVNHFKTYDDELSDHFPIMARLGKQD